MRHSFVEDETCGDMLEPVRASATSGRQSKKPSFLINQTIGRKSRLLLQSWSRYKASKALRRRKTARQQLYGVLIGAHTRRAA